MTFDRGMRLPAALRQRSPASPASWFGNVVRFCAGAEASHRRLMSFLKTKPSDRTSDATSSANLPVVESALSVSRVACSSWEPPFLRQ